MPTSFGDGWAVGSERSQTCPPGLHPEQVGECHCPLLEGRILVEWQVGTEMKGRVRVTEFGFGELRFGVPAGQTGRVSNRHVPQMGQRWKFYGDPDIIPVAVTAFGSVCACVQCMEERGKKNKSLSVVEVIHVYLLTFPISGRLLPFLIKLDLSRYGASSFLLGWRNEWQSLAYKKLRWRPAILTAS